MKQIVWQWVIQRTQVVNLAVVVWTFMGPAGGILASSPKVMNQPVVTVRIYNYANVDRLELKEGESQTAELFDRAGVRIDWTDDSHKELADRPGSEISNADFFLRILPASMARKWNYKPGALGESVISPGTHGPLPGGTANLFYDHVKHVSTLWDMFPGEVLGDAIAHELGHLLLGARHSSQGIMKARWTLRDLKAASRGRLLFSPAEGELLQTAARSLPRNSFTMAAGR